MRLHFRIDSPQASLAPHQRVSVFIDGGCCGTLTMRNEQFMHLQELLAAAVKASGGAHALQVTHGMAYPTRYLLGEASITCLTCGFTSHHPQDIANRYCASCHVFHDEQPLLIQSCSWCHEPNPIYLGRAETICWKCGHRADLPRALCDCAACLGEKESLRNA